MSRNLWPLAGFLLMVGLSTGGVCSDSPKFPAPFIDKPIPVFGPAALTMYRDRSVGMEGDAYRVPEKSAIHIGGVHRRDQIRPLTRVALEKDLLPLIQTMQRWYAAAILILVAGAAVTAMWAARADGATFAFRVSSPVSPSARVLVLSQKLATTATRGFRRHSGGQASVASGRLSPFHTVWEDGLTPSPRIRPTVSPTRAFLKSAGWIDRTSADNLRTVRPSVGSHG